MPEFRIFRWRDGRGWLVLSAGPDRTGEIRGTALGRAAADGAVACVAVSADPAAADRLLDDVEDLGAPSGYIVDIMAEDDHTIEDRLGEAGVIVLTADHDADSVRSALTGAALRGIEAAHGRGAVVVIEGVCALLFGGWYPGPDAEFHEGFSWLANAVVTIGAALDTAAEYAVSSTGYAFQLQIEPGSAIAFGPDGEIELWGRKQVKVLLKQN